jgi:RNA polymerase sigma factor (sigma-70 family)
VEDAVQTSPDHDLFLANLADIDLVIAAISRRHRLDADEADEFKGTAYMRLLEQDCRILRAFEGRSSIRTYLRVVLNRVFLDLRIARWGKWRPSTRAKRGGAAAVRLERLIHRDGLPEEIALPLVLRDADADKGVLVTFACQSRPMPRAERRMVSDEVLGNLPGDTISAHQALARAELHSPARRVLSALKKGLAQLPPDDQLIIRLRFVDRATVVEIAAVMRTSARKLYRRIDTILGRLRCVLEHEGCSADALAIVGEDKWRDILSYRDRNNGSSVRQSMT